MPGFSRDHRLLTARDYQGVFSDAQFKVGHKHFLVLARVGSRSTSPRLGLVVAKKHIRRAVSRNRIKRVARDSFRFSQGKLDSLDIVFMARTGLDQLDPAEQTRLIRDAWRRLSRKLQNSTSQKTLANENPDERSLKGPSQ